MSVHISPGAARFRSNRNALKIILSNLVENALVYSDTGSPVEVRIENVSEETGMARGNPLEIRVIDKGNGIPVDFVKTIFKPFVRLDKDVAVGAGLGLTLVRSLAELHGGSVHIQSEMGRGTTVCVTIPETPEDNEPDVVS